MTPEKIYYKHSYHSYVCVQNTRIKLELDEERLKWWTYTKIECESAEQTDKRGTAFETIRLHRKQRIYTCVCVHVYNLLYSVCPC